MALISLHNIQIRFGGPPLIENAGLHIESGERVCLVGRNGSGKSTLMKLISGELVPDSGEVIRQQGVRVARLTQEVPPELPGTVFDVVAGGLGDLVDLLSAYHRVSSRMGAEGDASLIEELERIQHDLDAQGGWRAHQRVETVLSRLHLPPDAPAGGLSGGYKRRVLLARALVSEPDLLLLDEPTNHLDIEAIEWLEELLLDFRGTLLFVTHDRMFLQKLATRIVEIDCGRLTDWPGEYAVYLKRRQAEREAEAGQQALFDKRLAREEAWIRQGIKARRTRNEGRVRALQEMRRERLVRREAPGSVRLQTNEAERTGKVVVEALDVEYRWTGQPLLTGFSTTIMRGDKIGIIGPNGSGKTTLLRILLGELAPDQGTVRHGTRLEVAYFDQHREQLEEEKSARDNVSEGSENVFINGAPRHIVGYLQDFLFPPERARLPVKVLSGGERNRLLLAKLFTRPSNVLVLDEPTNDLDMETLELLEELLMEYKGTVLLVSHDRAFLNNVVTGTLVFGEGGRISEYVGGYDDWLRQRPSAVPSRPAAVEKKEKSRPQNERPRKLTYREQQELETLPQRIEALEAEQQALYRAMSDPAFYRQDGDAIAAVRTRAEELEQAVNGAYRRWEELEAR
ncbi:MAG: ATP-binding cassette domain-containing protein [Nitrospirales bacterium]|nr:ATP-binding cassette domain-containing protein [Nitrospirales bacterium]